MITVLWLVHGLLLGAAALLLVPAVVVALQVLAALAPARAPARKCAAVRPRTAILVPAHNEEGGLAATLRPLRAQLVPGDRLLVVADNCSDRTAEVAAQEGAEVVERHDPVRRGKGYALDRGIQHLASDPPDVVLIVDADCQVGEAAVTTLVCSSAASQRPVQALYLMRAPPGAALRARLGEFAWVVRNQARPLGAHRLGLPCQLMGTGMALPWRQIQGAPLASGQIVEDLQLGLDLACAGAAPRFCPDALVTSHFPSSAASLGEQRMRWEHGHLAVLTAQVPRLLWQAVRQRRVDLAALALDLGVPPLASLVLMLLAVLAAASTVGVASEQWLATKMTLAALALLGSAVLAGWWRFGRSVVLLRELLGIPVYLVAKLPIYLRLLLKRRQTDWVRTERDDRSP